MSRVLLAGNWKMYKTVDEAVDLIEALKAGLHTQHGVDIAVCTPFTALLKVSELLQNSNIDLGAQNMHASKEGAFTGEISPLMLKDVGCRYVILGHSERRQYFHETDKIVNEKIKSAISCKLDPIVCVGELLEEREKNQTFDVVSRQLSGALDGLTPEQISELVIAYEPVWAIGTGKTATSQQAQEVHQFIRKQLIAKSTPAIAKNIRILYGGSVKPDNIADLVAQADIDGGLIGGASLKAESFIQIVENAALAAEKVNS